MQRIENRHHVALILPKVHLIDESHEKQPILHPPMQHVARSALTLADHDSQVTQPFPHLTIVVRSSWGCIWAVCSVHFGQFGGWGASAGKIVE